MRKAGTRKRLATNIFQDAYGISGIVRLRGHVVEVRVPLGTKIGKVRAAMALRVRQLEDRLPVEAARGTLQAAVNDALDKLPTKTRRHQIHRQDRAQLYRAWTDRLGHELFALITGPQLRAVLETWQQAGDSPARISKRISALRVLWRAYAPDATTFHPIERLQRPRGPRATLDKALPLSLVQRILAAARVRADSAYHQRSYRRLCVWAWTGLPPSLAELITEADIRRDTDPPELYVQPRRKGAGVDGAWIPLIPPASLALQALIETGAAGGYWHPGNLRRAWNLAREVVVRQLKREKRTADAKRLARATPLWLRHSFLTALGTATGDIYGVAEAARHSDIKTTRRYMLGSSSPRMKAAISTLGSTLQFHVSRESSQENTNRAPRNSE